MGGLRGQEILIIIILLILVFGWKKLPDAARSLGRSARVFKSEVEEMKKDGKDGAQDSPVPSEARQQPVIPPPAGSSQQPPSTGYQPPTEQPHYQQPPQQSGQYQQPPHAQPQHTQPQYTQPQHQQPAPQQPQRQDPPDDPTRPVA